VFLAVKQMNKLLIKLHHRLFAVLTVLWGASHATFAADELQKSIEIKRIPIGSAFAATAINADVFRCSSLTTRDGVQFAIYFDGSGNVTTAQRKIDSDQFTVFKQAFKGNIKDAHNSAVIGVSGDGKLHISYDHHNNPLRYRVSNEKLSAEKFGDLLPMTGQDEEKVTYPQFVNAPDGSLYFFYRNGASGNGSLCINRYDVSTSKWEPIHHPLIDGQGKRNPYWWRPAIGNDGSIHLAWCWRESPAAETNHDLNYMVSHDAGKTWQHSDGSGQKLPVILDNAEVVDKIPRGSNLINQCSTAVDTEGHPHMVHYMNDSAGIVQYFHTWFDGKAWHRIQVSNRTTKFSLGGGGSLALPISRPEFAVSKTGIAYLIARESDSPGIRIYSASAPYEKWEPHQLTTQDLGEWEPTYDQARWGADNTLDIFELPVKQGNHETTTDFPPQTANVVEVKF